MDNFWPKLFFADWMPEGTVALINPGEDLQITDLEGRTRTITIREPSMVVARNVGKPKP